MKQFGIGNTLTAHSPRLDYFFDDWISNFLQNFGINWNPSLGTVNGATYDSYADPSVPIYWVVRALEVFEDFQQFGTYLVQNPVEAFQYLISTELFDWPLHLEEIGIFLVQNPALLAPLASAALAPVGAVGGFAGLAGLAAIQPPPVVPAPVPAPPPVSYWFRTTLFRETTSPEQIARGDLDSLVCSYVSAIVCRVFSPGNYVTITLDA